MPVTPSALSLAIINQFSGVGFRSDREGNRLSDMASAVGNAVGNYLITPNLVTGFLSGTSGISASVTSLGVFGLVPQAMGLLMTQRASGSDIAGRDAPKFFNAVATGISIVLQSAFLTGTAAGIGPGTGIGRFTALNEVFLSLSIQAQLFGKDVAGRDVPNISDAIASGIVNHLLSVTFPLSAVGAIAPTPPVGPVPVVGIPTVTTKIS